jgi:hypothetical protein
MDGEVSRVKEDLKRSLEDLKDLDERCFERLTDNFYLMRSALRYFSRKRSSSFNSSRISENFPLTVPVAGSCLYALEKLDVVESRGKSNSPDVFMPQKVDIDRMERIQDVLLESREIREFN